jgi:mRNA interferase MazF
MKRGEFYRVKKPGAGDLKKQHVFVVVSRQALIDSRFSTVTCAPVYSRRDGLSTQVPVGVREGLKKDSSIHCDELLSLPKSVLTNYAGYVGDRRMKELDAALAIALDLPEPAPMSYLQ